ncbi:polysaccharide biosynthesis/export family protein [Luteolibacter algae]|uniref:Polysaccharide biosynthesis/export family protein n=1 Tax=Luteolibacter algae TaxID=454151 RepID=A0ABW5D4V1_9BACT
MCSISVLLVSAILVIFTSRATAAEDAKSSYTLRPSDLVRLSVYEEPELDTEVRILKSGQASFPLIGSVEVAGLSVTAATAKIRDLYAKDYLVDPQVTLTVDEYATDFVSVIGQVKEPGQIPIPQTGGLDIGSALATTGGITENADENNIQIVRANGSSNVLTIAAIQGGAGRGKLGSGDRIIVHESRYVRSFVTILGRVGKPGAVPFPIDGRLDLVTAIAMAGGLTELANPKKVSVNRKGRVSMVDFRELSEKGGDSIWLQPGDIVSVAERFF